MKKKIRNINKKYLLMIKKILERKRRSLLNDYPTLKEKKLLFQIEDEYEYFDRNNSKVRKKGGKSLKKNETKSGWNLKRIYLQAIGMWFVFVILFIVNGILRNDGYGPIVDNELLAHQISTAIGLAFLFIIMFFFFERTSAKYTQKDLLIIGILWFSMTILFEFIFGHYVIGHTWSKLLHDYNIFNGHVWILVLLWTAIGPFIIGKILEKKQSDASYWLISKAYNLEMRR